MANVLFVHNNFPGQFGALAEALRARGDRCAAIASRTGRELPGIPLLRWATGRGSTPGLFPLATRAEADMIRGRAAAECAVRLRDQGFTPDLIVGHPGWGETLFLREVWPRARMILHGEFYYRSRGGDTGFDPEWEQPSPEQAFRVAAKNATLALAYAEADRLVCPTPFQAGMLPDSLRARAAIIHEGVDTDRIRRREGARLRLGGRVLDASTPVITFINRRFEPLRGFHIFMRALPGVLAAVPEARAVLIGADEAGGYGAAAPEGTTWKAHLLAEIGPRLDLSRVHFTGRLAHADMLAALSCSSAHVYYTYPFVLSWSLLEAMASECLVVGSDTAPVRDVVRHGENGLLHDFFDVPALTETLISACREPARFAPLRAAARRTVVEGYDRTRRCLPGWLATIDEQLGRGPVPDAGALPPG